MNPMHEANRKGWDAASATWQAMVDREVDVNEYHPFRRIWRDSSDRLELEFGYFERGPHQYDRADGVPGAPPGSLPSHEFHWTVADYVTAPMGGGCELVAIREYGNQRERWESAPMSGLPSSLLLVGRKRCERTDGLHRIA